MTNEKNEDINFVVRLSLVYARMLDKLAEVTGRTKAQAVRASIMMAYRLFTSNQSGELEKQNDTEG